MVALLPVSTQSRSLSASMTVEEPSLRDWNVGGGQQVGEHGGAHEAADVVEHDDGGRLGVQDRGDDLAELDVVGRHLGLHGAAVEARERAGEERLARSTLVGLDDAELVRRRDERTQQRGEHEADVRRAVVVAHEREVLEHVEEIHDVAMRRWSVVGESGTAGCSPTGR